ncbi:MAG: hypothetical protein MMC33_006323 [Icmadophila ericetorum]|nr:hypothetical protein [Icmadophila ericetorum]
MASAHLAPPQPAPPLNIPESSSTVKVSIVDTTAWITLPSGLLVHPLIKGNEIFAGPSLAFLIEHSNGSSSTTRKVLFDLGVRMDWMNLAKLVVDNFETYSMKVTIEKSLADILQDGGVKYEEIEGLFWSHYHWDHTGDPSLFPPHTKLIVGPGFKDAFLPGFPANPKSPILETDYANREFVELNFEESGLKLGRFGAVDYFGDGSFYLLDAPGHTIAHVCGLARTTTNPDTFIFMGGDACHHGGEFRPTKYLPLPKEISPHPFHTEASDAATMPPCPGSIFEAIHHNKRPDEPFLYVPNDDSGATYDVKEATESIAKLTEFDCNEDVFTVIAHDPYLRGIVDFFPSSANEWKSKGWAKKGKWAFLKDFRPAVEEEQLRSTEAGDFLEGKSVVNET